VAKYNIDDILSELGVDAPAPKEKGPPPKVHTIDEVDVPPPGVLATPVPANGQAASAPAIGRAAPAPEPAFTMPVMSSSEPSAGPDLSDIYSPPTPEPQPNGTAPAPGLGEMLLAKGLVTAERLTVAQQVIKASPGKHLADVLIEQGVDEAAVQAAVAELAGIPFERINLDTGLDGGFDGKLLQRLTPEFCKRHTLIPLRTEGSRVVIGTTQADNVFLLDEVRQALGGPGQAPGVKLVLVTAFDVKAALEIVGGGAAPTEDVSKILSEVEDADVQVEKQAHEEVDLEKEAGESPVIRYVNYIIQAAVKEGASDIHIEPSEKKLKVRFRIDGELFEMMNPPASMGPAIVSRLKIMGNLDISERRLPQDGRIRCTVSGRKLDLRLSTLPCGYGEKVVMRILDTRSINVELENLGFDENTYTIWKKQIDAPHGIVLVTGPTGSGKTTTLYSSLRQLDKNSMNICTVEDPVEYHLEGITQTQMHEKIGMTFAAALRSLLRQDPDVIMLGEIRDQETAIIAVQAALTGHLVLSTLHTNDAPASITRLVNIGLEPFLVGAAVNSVLAQRLIRKLCTHCKQMDKPNDEMKEFLAMHSFDTDEIWAAKGCDKCRNTGYSGRIGIYELLTVDDQLRDTIARNPNVSEFRRMCIERGMVTLRADGMRKVAKGITTVQEVLRVTEATH
jgi:type IV pilus assembly protein PilB